MIKDTQSIHLGFIGDLIIEDDTEEMDHLVLKPFGFKKTEVMSISKFTVESLMNVKGDGFTAMNEEGVDEMIFLNQGFKIEVVSPNICFPNESWGLFLSVRCALYVVDEIWDKTNDFLSEQREETDDEIMIVLEMTNTKFAIKDDYFHHKLSLIYQLGLDEQLERLSREELLSLRIIDIGNLTVSKVENAWKKLYEKHSNIWVQRVNYVLKCAERNPINIFSLNAAQIKQSLVYCSRKRRLRHMLHLDPSIKEISSPWGWEITGYIKDFTIKFRNYVYPVVKIDEISGTGYLLVGRHYVEQQRISRCYNSWDLKTEGLEIGYGKSYEPCIQQISVSLERLNCVENLDTELLPPTLPWWDMLRRDVRCKIKAVCASPVIYLLTCKSPHDKSDFLEVGADRVTVFWGTNQNEMLLQWSEIKYNLHYHDDDMIVLETPWVNWHTKFFWKRSEKSSMTDPNLEDRSSGLKLKNEVECGSRGNEVINVFLDQRSFWYLVENVYQPYYDFPIRVCEGFLESAWSPRPPQITVFKLIDEIEFQLKAIDVMSQFWFNFEMQDGLNCTSQTLLYNVDLVKETNGFLTEWIAVSQTGEGEHVDLVVFSPQRARAHVDAGQDDINDYPGEFLFYTPFLTYVQGLDNQVIEDDVLQQYDHQIVVNDMKFSWTVETRNVIYNWMEMYNEYFAKQLSREDEREERMKKHGFVAGSSPQFVKLTEKSVGNLKILRRSSVKDKEKRTSNADSLLNFLMSDEFRKKPAGGESDLQIKRFQSPIKEGSGSLRDIFNEEQISNTICIKLVKPQANLRVEGSDGCLVLAADYGYYSILSSSKGAIGLQKAFWLTVPECVDRAGFRKGISNVVKMLTINKVVGYVARGFVDLSSSSTNAWISPEEHEKVGREDSIFIKDNILVPVTGAFTFESLFINYVDRHFRRGTRKPQKNATDHEGRTVDIYVLHIPQLVFNTENFQYIILSNIFSNLLVGDSPKHIAELVQMEELGFKNTLTMTRDRNFYKQEVNNQIKILQKEIKKLEEDSKNLERKRNIDSSERETAIRLSRKAIAWKKKRYQEFLNQSELLEQNKSDADDCIPGQGMKVLYLIDRFVWTLNEKEKPIVSISFNHFDILNYIYEDLSGFYDYTVQHFNVSNPNGNAVYTTVASSNHIKSTSRSDSLGQLAIRIIFHEDSKVGGIHLYSHTQFSFAELRLNLEYELAKNVWRFFVPNATEEMKAYNARVEYLNQIQQPSTPNTPKSESFLSAIPGPSRVRTASYQQRRESIFKEEGDTPIIRKLTFEEKGHRRTKSDMEPILKRQESNKSIAEEPEEERAKEVVSDDDGSPDLRRQKSIVRQRDHKSKSVSKSVSVMKTRAAQSIMFSYVNIAPVEVILSWRGAKEKSALDFCDWMVRLSPFEYRNQQWSWEEFGEEIKKDIIVDVLTKLLTRNLVTKSQKSMKNVSSSNEGQSISTLELEKQILSLKGSKKDDSQMGQKFNDRRQQQIEIATKADLLLGLDTQKKKKHWWK